MVSIPVLHPITRLLRDPDLRRKMGQAGRERVERPVEWDTTSGKLPTGDTRRQLWYTCRRRARREAMTVADMSATVPIQIETYRRTFRQRMQRDREEREERRRQALRAVWKKVPAILAAYPSVRRAYLFGSVTRPGAFHPASDVDIVLEGTTASEYFAVWRDLERALPGWMVDVREITAPSPFAHLIRETGVLIYERASSPAPD